ncbi:hypothetical protein CHS0354_035705 [Potamilus streckersoni]|uniref:Uncharacterized protein n=1 Tax=Potamilus streckersoni TaxID=2493646 RepID=A0AAE0TCE7_9BIVA|nr:hypothetical protein CHS0354_035705 [Potamilus streckersoni]
MRFTSKTPAHSNVKQTESSLSVLSSTVNSTIVNLTATQSSVSFTLYYSNTYPSGASHVPSRSSQLTTISPVVNINLSSNSFNDTALPSLTQSSTSFSSYFAIGTTIPEVHVTPTIVSIATSALMSSQTTGTSQKLPSGKTSTEIHQIQSSLLANLQPTVPVSMHIDPGTTFQTSKTETNVSNASHGFEFSTLTNGDWTTLAMINSTISSNWATKHVENKDPTLDTILEVLRHLLWTLLKETDTRFRNEVPDFARMI